MVHVQVAVFRRGMQSAMYSMKLCIPNAHRVEIQVAFNLLPVQCRLLKPQSLLGGGGHADGTESNCI